MSDQVTVGSLWGIWIGTFLVSLLIIGLLLWLFRGNNYKSLSWGIAVFLSLIIAAIVTYGCAVMIDTNTLDSTNQGWYYALLAVIIILPILSLIYLIFFASDFSCFKKSCEEPCEKPAPECLPCEKPAAKKVEYVKPKPACEPCVKPKPACEPCVKPKPVCEKPKPACDPCEKPKPACDPCAKHKPAFTKPEVHNHEHRLTHDHLDVKVNGKLSYDAIGAY